MQRVIVIGAGVGGLATAIRLAVLGYQVTVYEQNSSPGGRISLLESDGYRFNTGPALFTDPHLIEELFHLAEEPVASCFSYQELTNSCRYFFFNGKVANAYTNSSALEREFADKLGEPEKMLGKYMETAERVYRGIGDVFTSRPIYRCSEWWKKGVWKGITSCNPSLLYHTLNEYNERHLTTGEAIQVFNQFAAYAGSSPFRSPAMLIMIAHLALSSGVFYLKGGMGMTSMVQALYKLALKKGVLFQFGKKVTRIIHTGSMVRGVVVDDENIYSDIVVADADIHFVYSRLLRQPAKAACIAGKEPGSSAVVFYWGIKKLFPKLHLHNILFSASCKHEFEHIFGKRILHKDPTLHISITSKMESGQAPEGCENWVVMLNAPSDAGIDWSSQLPQIRQQVLKKIRGMLKEDIEPLIEVEQVLHPGIIRDATNALHGALYGQSAHTLRGTFFRPSNFDKDFPGVFFCGGTVHPGGGVPLCLKSAAIVSELVKKAFPIVKET